MTTTSGPMLSKDEVSKLRAQLKRSMEWVVVSMTLEIAKKLMRNSGTPGSIDAFHWEMAQVIGPYVPPEGE